MTDLTIPDAATTPLAAFLWSKSLAPEYPQGADVTVVACELLAACAPAIIAAELRRLADAADRKCVRDREKCTRPESRCTYCRDLQARTNSATIPLRQRARQLDPDGAL